MSPDRRPEGGQAFRVLIPRGVHPGMSPRTEARGGTSLDLRNLRDFFLFLFFYTNSLFESLSQGGYDRA